MILQPEYRVGRNESGGRRNTGIVDESKSTDDGDKPDFDKVTSRCEPCWTALS